MLVLEMNDADRCWDTDTHAYRWAGKTTAADRGCCHIDSRLHAHRPGHALARDQGQPHTMLGTRGYTRVMAGRVCKWQKGIPPQKVV